VIRLDSQIQNYDWGSRGAIADLLGREPSGEPEAELWMGAHPRCPSRISGQGTGGRDLSELIASDPQRFLGKQVAERYGRLPFLFKVLAAAQPLSLQAHPNMKQARLGFSKEEEAGVPLSAAHRNYKDASHKPELILALSPFSALSGFRRPEEALALVRTFCPAPAGRFRSDLLSFADAPNEAGLRVFFQALFALPPNERTVVVAEAGKIGGLEDLSGEAKRLAPWVVSLAQLYPGDAGVVASLLLNLVELSPGEAMYLPAGNLHAYLSGLGLEIMASSDNVLRGGLTSKHVELPELTSILSFQHFSPLVQTGIGETVQGGRCTRFITEAEEFELSVVVLTAGEFQAAGPEIWLLLEGQLACSDSETVFRRGDQLFVSANERVTARGSARFARASLGRRSA
jgi:mannose-6-phosphate isomerase